MMRPLLSLVVVLLALGGILIEVSHVRAWRLRELAESDYYNGDFYAALSKYERVTALRSGEPRSHTDPADTISQYLSGSGQDLPLDEFEALTAKSVYGYLKAIDSGPPGAWSYSRLAVLAEALGRARRADEEIDLGRLRGDVSTLHAEDRFGEAAWVKAIEIEPRNFYYRDFIGDFYLRRGFTDLALEHLRYSVRLHPVVDAHYYLDEFATLSPVVLNAVESGVQDALEAEDTFVSEYDIHRFLAALYLKLDRRPDAIKSLEEATKVAPLPHRVDVQIGQILAQSGDDAGALEAYHRAAERKPDSARVWRSLAVTHSRMGNHDDAVEAAYRARNLVPGDYATSSTLAGVLETAGRSQDAIAVLETILMTHRDKPVVYGRLIDLYEQTGQIGDATRVARRLAARYPEEELYQEQLRQLERAVGAEP